MRRAPPPKRVRLQFHSPEPPEPVTPGSTARVAAELAPDARRFLARLLASADLADHFPDPGKVGLEELIDRLESLADGDPRPHRGSRRGSPPFHVAVRTPAAAPSGGLRACRVCGCTELRACVVDGTPCSWVGADDLCSACEPPAPTEAA